MIGMNTIYRVLSVAALIAACHAASAQDLDPTVIVDRAYEGKLIEVHKPALEMAVPDSLMRFDLDFDYSVFDRPYKGSYEFNPYLLSMKPSVSSDREGKLYLRAGAGYQLHPELDVVWSPKMRDDDFDVDVYARHRSFIGNYSEVVSGDGLVVDAADGVWKGYDLDSRAGVAMKYDWDKGMLGLDFGYLGLHQNDKLHRRGYNAVNASFDVSSKDSGLSDFVYDLSTDFRYAADDATNTSGTERNVNETNFDVGFMARKGVKEGKAFLFDAALSLDGYKGYVDAAAADFHIKAGYVYRKGLLQADLGVKIAAYMADTTLAVFDAASKNQILYPDVRIRLNVIPEYLAMFVSATGGARMNSYSSILNRNHHAVLSFPGIVQTNPDWMEKKEEIFGWKMGAEVERVTAQAGFEGRIGSDFSYVLTGGYTNYGSGLLDAVSVISVPSMFFNGIFAGIEYVPYQKAFASLNWRWSSESLSSYGNITYTDAFGDVFDKNVTCLKPAALTGDVAFGYNYRKRVFAELSCEFSGRRTGGHRSVTIPGYADLGLGVEYVTSGPLSFWLHGGNLLGMAVQRNLLYIEKGPYFTLGLSLKL